MSVKKIQSHIVNEKLRKKEILLVDVREPAEHRSESIEGAHLIPLSKISHEKLPPKQPQL